MLKHLLVDSGFLENVEGVGAAAAGHAIEAHGTAFEVKGGVFAYFGFGYAEVGAERVGGFLACCNYGVTLGQLTEQVVNVGVFNDF